MRRLVISQLRAGRLRLLLTVIGVALAVGSTVAATLIRDGQRDGLTALADRTVAEIDLQVSGAALDVDRADAIRSVDGVASAAVVVEAPWHGTTVSGRTDTLDTDGLPVIASTWSDPALNPFDIVEGRVPEAGEFVVDHGSIERFGLVVGERYEIVSGAVQTPLVLAGTTELEAGGPTGGALFVHVAAADARALGPDASTTIAVAVDDDRESLAVADVVAAVVPGADVLGANDVTAAVRDRYLDAFTAEADVLRTALAAFAAVTLLVSVCIVANTFTISIGQRSREIGLLRVTGATARQVRFVVMGEAIALSAIGAGLGLPVGLWLARGIGALFNATGDDLPAFPVTLGVRSVLVAFAVGVVVSALAALPAARRSTSGPALVALSGEPSSAQDTRRGRAIVAAVALVAGAAMLWAAVASSADDTGTASAYLVAGALAILIGVAAIAPLLVAPTMAVLARSFGRWGGAPVRLAARNASRHPKRTARTAAALTIGLGVATATFVVGHSVRETFRSSSEAIVGDYVVDRTDGGTFEASVASTLGESPVVDSVAAFRFATIVTDGVVGATAAVDFLSMAGLYRPDIVAGAAPGDVSNAALVLEQHAGRTGLAIGDVVAVELPAGVVDATITGVYRGNALFGTDFLFDDSVYDDGGERTGASWLVVGIDDAASTGAIDAAVDRWEQLSGEVAVETAASLNERLGRAIGDALVFINALTAVAVVVALFGIANTMALSALERVREVGLVRSVGMDRGQVRRMVRVEGAFVALFGGALGVALGIVVGSAGALVLPDHWADTIAVPVLPIVVLVAVALLCGVSAAILPARRAARTDVLTALAM